MNDEIKKAGHGMIGVKKVRTVTTITEQSPPH
jgi:hypothetical protein